MAKLQLYLTRSLDGVSSLLNINPAEEVSRLVQDFRPALAGLDYDIARSHVFYLISYTPEGLLLTTIRTITHAEAGSYLSASVFIPEGTEIASSEILHIATSLAEKLDPQGNPPSADEVAELRHSFSTDFEENLYAPRHSASSGTHFGLIHLGNGAPELADYAKARFYQPLFPRYSAVILAEHTVSLKENADTVADITPGAIVPTAILIPPRKTPQGFAPYLDRKRFTRPAIIPAGTDITVEWQRPGFDSIEQTVRADHPGMEMRITPPDTSEAAKTISPSSFRVTIQGSQQNVGDVSIKVNGDTIDQAKTYRFNELVAAAVEVAAPGYTSFTGTLDLASTAVALIQLKPQRRTYRFDLPLNTPEPSEPVRIYLKTRRPIKQCPIEGYAVAGGAIEEGTTVSNNLYYVGGFRTALGRYRHLIYGVFGLLAGIVIGCLVTGLRRPAPTEAHAEIPADTVNTKEAPAAPSVEEPVAQPVAQEPQPVQKPVEAPTPPPAADYTKAVAYLDANKNWTREGMAEIDGLEGLFDDLNTYNFTRLKEYWAPLLSSSRNFAAVIAAVNGSATKRDPRTGAHKPNYNTDGDNSIAWISYTYWIDP